MLQNEDSSSALPSVPGSPSVPPLWVRFLPNEAQVAPLKDQLQIVNAKLPLALGAPFPPILPPSPSSCSLLAFDEHMWVD